MHNMLPNTLWNKITITNKLFNKNDSEYLSISLIISCTKPTFTVDTLVLKQTSLFRNKFLHLYAKVQHKVDVKSITYDCQLCILY